MDAYRVHRNLPLPVLALGCALTGHLLFGDGMLVAAMVQFLAVLFLPFALSQRKSQRG
jgi:hypothetical protein